MLVVDHRIGLHVAHVHSETVLGHVRVLLAHQPAAMSKEEASLNVHRISIRLRVLVMHSVVSGPHEDAVLVGHRVAEGEEDAQGELGLVRSVRPETMDTGGDAKEG